MISNYLLKACPLAINNIDDFLNTYYAGSMINEKKTTLERKKAFSNTNYFCHFFRVALKNYQLFCARFQGGTKKCQLFLYFSRVAL